MGRMVSLEWWEEQEGEEMGGYVACERRRKDDLLAMTLRETHQPTVGGTFSSLLGNEVGRAKVLVLKKRRKMIIELIVNFIFHWVLLSLSLSSRRLLWIRGMNGIEDPIERRERKKRKSERSENREK